MRRQAHAVKRRAFMALAGVASIHPFTVRAQQMRRIVIIFSTSEGSPQSMRDLAALKAGLQEHGWTDGRNIQVEVRWAGGDPGGARTAAMEAIAQAPALIVASGTPSLQALHDARTAVPIVFLNITDPVAGGFVASLARPGGNVTGFTPFEYDIGGKWLELLKEAAPGLKRVAMLGDPANHNFSGFKKSFETAAAALAVEPIAVPIRVADDIERGIHSLAEAPNGGLIITAASFSIVNRDRIVGLAIRYKLPGMYWNRVQVEAGGLMSYAPDTAVLHGRSADYIDRILKGAAPANLPVQGPTKVDLTINLRTAKAIDLVIPPGLLARADEVIE